MKQKECWEILIEKCINHFGPIKNEDYIKMMYDVKIDKWGPCCSDDALRTLVHYAWGIDDEQFINKELWEACFEYCSEAHEKGKI